MSRYVFKVPDLGEGTVSSEIVAWRVQPGDLVKEDQPLVEMSTDKAVVELPAPVSGRVLTLAGAPGDVVAVGAELVVFETDAAVSAANEAPAAVPAAASAPTAAPAATSPPVQAPAAAPSRIQASPATRHRARAAGIDLSEVSGSGPGGRILRQDLEGAMADRAKPGPETSPATRARREGTEEIRIIGVRRVIAERMAEAKRTIPHFSYVEEVDITELERLREHLNSRRQSGDTPLTLLPLIVAALTRVLVDFPQCNALYDAARNTVVRHRAVHLGLATQTPDGLKVPVVRHVEALSLRALAGALRQAAEGARRNTARREDLTGSTITVTSLGRLGGIVSTPVINAPEVAIIGVNKAVDRPVVLAGAVTIRRMMNLSSSFDHRFVDGYDAAAMIQALKTRLEHPATIFIDD
jgi:2-oxoisovalerate dehydrogenase E2 component (dihydrolipoyl transacylase)